MMLIIAGVPVPALADNCKSNGGLIFVGTTTDSASSVWLSATSPGAFRLEAAQGNTTVDEWTRDRRGLHISISPFVSSGNGGTHRLFETSDPKPCLIDTQNQKGGFKIPPNITHPGGRPGGVTRPPIGNLFPDFQPPTTLPGTVPPSGITPGMPTLPPSGITPGVPTLPPSGITPGVPTVPPSGITPGVPTLPPSGITPGRPGGGVPPIATLPPSGITPGVPTLPPSGITPGRPGGGVPPIATLPPSGITPGRPGVTRPTAPLPPGARTRSERQRTAARAKRPPPECVDPRDPRRPASGGRATTVACPDPRFSELPRTPATIGGTVPLTPGRDLGVDRPWNAWSETYLGSINDRRYGLDLKSRVVTATFGLDRRVTTDVVTGFSFSIEQGKSTGFGDFLRADTEGFSVGPYVAVRLSPNWAIDAALSYTQTKIDLEIAILNASYISPQYTGSVKLHGQYQVLGGSVRPKLSVNYSHIVSNAYDLQGRIFQGLPFERLINIHFPRDSTNLGYSEASVEATRIFSFSNGTQVMPYSELGVRYEFERPNGGEILTGDLKLAIPAQWSGYVKSGVRASILSSILVDVSAGYLSLGHTGLEAWEGRFRVSYGF